LSCAISGRGSEDLHLELRFVGKNLTHNVGGAPCRGVIVVSIALERERGGGVPRESLKIPYGLAALGE
jgi:hypothetical protein